jgi:hypothetical protein
VRFLHNFGVKGSPEKVEKLDSLSCGSSVIVFVVMRMVVIAKPCYLSGWMI